MGTHAKHRSTKESGGAERKEKALRPPERRRSLREEPRTEDLLSGLLGYLLYAEDGAPGESLDAFLVRAKSASRHGVQAA